jgi:hypothetical protein
MSPSRTTALRSGGTMIPLASVIVEVLAARNDNDTMVSTNGSVGGMDKPAGGGVGKNQVLTSPDRVEASGFGVLPRPGPRLPDSRTCRS